VGEAYELLKICHNLPDGQSELAIVRDHLTMTTPKKLTIDHIHILECETSYKWFEVLGLNNVFSNFTFLQSSNPIMRADHFLNSRRQARR
jgi:hypothetical protein